MASASLLLYSGIPNPTLVLSDVDRATLLDLVHSSTELSPVPLHIRLGYSGVTVEFEDDTPVVGLIAHGGVVAIFKGPNELSIDMVDTESRIEQFVRSKFGP